MKKLILLGLSILLTNIVFTQTIIKDTVQVNTGVHSVLTVNGGILKLDMGKNIILSEEPLSNGENTYISLKSLNTFKGYDFINIINDKNEYYTIAVEYKKNIPNPFFFIGKNNLKKISIKSIYEGGELDASVKKVAEEINKKKGESLQRIFVKENNVLLKVVDISSYRDKILIRLLIDNHSAYSFIVEGISFKISEYETWKKTSSPEEVVIPLFQTDKNIKVETNKKAYVTFVFNGFKIPKNRILKIGIMENKLTNEYFLNIEGKYINNPKRYEEVKKQN
jgi:hypothetical protein